MCSQVRPRKILTLKRTGMTKSEVKSTHFWPKATLASSPGRLGGVSIQTWTPTLILASSDMDANLSGLHAQQSCKLLKQ
ncbi:hypothetical protein Taro_042829, partial [Colocasia esculenta]|nr:hypothetical protein [Colocasia esculenta]